MDASSKMRNTGIHQSSHADDSGAYNMEEIKQSRWSFVHVGAVEVVLIAVFVAALEAELCDSFIAK